MLQHQENDERQSVQEIIESNQNLTVRQKEVVRVFLQSGNKNQVARELKMRPDTVREHLIAAKNKSQEIRSLIEKQELRGSRKRVSSNADEIATSSELLELIAKQDYKCALTGECLKDPSAAELDHCIPLNLGGTNKIDNLQWVLKSINRMKGTLPQAEFIELCKKVANFSKTI
jgi:5-methylcytosine-specific restriction endonuclease McrA